jgi:hypothetical protein
LDFQPDYAVISQIISNSQEFLFLFAIAWGLGSAALFKKLDCPVKLVRFWLVFV